MDFMPPHMAADAAGAEQEHAVDGSQAAADHQSDVRMDAEGYEQEGCQPHADSGPRHDDMEAEHTAQQQDHHEDMEQGLPREELHAPHALELGDGAALPEQHDAPPQADEFIGLERDEEIGPSDGEHQHLPQHVQQHIAGVSTTPFEGHHRMQEEMPEGNHAGQPGPDIADVEMPQQHGTHAGDSHEEQPQQHIAHAGGTHGEEPQQQSGEPCAGADAAAAAPDGEEATVLAEQQQQQQQHAQGGRPSDAGHPQQDPAAPDSAAAVPDPVAAALDSVVAAPDTAAAAPAETAAASSKQPDAAPKAQQSNANGSRGQSSAKAGDKGKEKDAKAGSSSGKDKGKAPASSSKDKEKDKPSGAGKDKEKDAKGKPPASAPQQHKDKAARPSSDKADGGSSDKDKGKDGKPATAAAKDDKAAPKAGSSSRSKHDEKDKGATAGKGGSAVGKGAEDAGKAGKSGGSKSSAKPEGGKVDKDRGKEKEKDKDKGGKEKEKDKGGKDANGDAKQDDRKGGKRVSSSGAGSKERRDRERDSERDKERAKGREPIPSFDSAKLSKRPRSPSPPGRGLHPSSRGSHGAPLSPGRRRPASPPTRRPASPPARRSGGPPSPRRPPHLDRQPQRQFEHDYSMRGYQERERERTLEGRDRDVGRDSGRDSGRDRDRDVGAGRPAAYPDDRHHSAVAYRDDPYGAPQQLRGPPAGYDAYARPVQYPEPPSTYGRAEQVIYRDAPLPAYVSSSARDGGRGAEYDARHARRLSPARALSPRSAGAYDAPRGSVPLPAPPRGGSGRALSPPAKRSRGGASPPPGRMLSPAPPAPPPLHGLHPSQMAAERPRYVDERDDPRGSSRAYGSSAAYPTVVAHRGRSPPPRYAEVPDYRAVSLDPYASRQVAGSSRVAAVYPPRPGSAYEPAYGTRTVYDERGVPYEAPVAAVYDERVGRTVAVVGPGYMEVPPLRERERVRSPGHAAVAYHAGGRDVYEAAPRTSAGYEDDRYKAQAGPRGVTVAVVPPGPPPQPVVLARGDAGMLDSSARGSGHDRHARAPLAGAWNANGRNAAEPPPASGGDTGGGTAAAAVDGSGAGAAAAAAAAAAADRMLPPGLVQPRGSAAAAAGAAAAAAAQLGNEDEKAWFYIDPQGTTQGPCSLRDLKRWVSSLNAPDYVNEYNQFLQSMVWKQGAESSRCSLQRLLGLARK